VSPVITYPPQLSNSTTLEPTDGRLPNMVATPLGLYRMLKGVSGNEERGHANVMAGRTICKNQENEIAQIVLGFYSRSMESIVAFSQWFFRRVNLRLTKKET
jgi:hypothetical protein